MICTLWHRIRWTSIRVGVALVLACANHAVLFSTFTAQGQAYIQTSIAPSTLDDTVASKPLDVVAGGCNESLTIRDTVVCGDVVAHVSIRPISTTCRGLRTIYADDIWNYKLVVDSTFELGESTVTFWLRVIDKSQSDGVRVRVESMRGNGLIERYEYDASRVQFWPDRFSFERIDDAEQPCAVVRLTNVTDQDIHVDSILMKNHAEVFRVTPTRTTVHAKSSVDIEICVDPGRNYSILDTLVLRLGCFDMMATELSARRVVPRVNIGDQNWGTVPADRWVRRPVVIQNVGTLPVIIYDYDRSLLDPVRSNFYDPLSLNEHLPLSIPAGSRHTFTVVYSPKGEIDVEHRLDIPFLTNASIYDTVTTFIGKGGSTCTVTDIVVSSTVTDQMRQGDSIPNAFLQNVLRSMVPNNELLYYLRRRAKERSHETHRKRILNFECLSIFNENLVLIYDEKKARTLAQDA